MFSQVHAESSDALNMPLSWRHPLHLVEYHRQATYCSSKQAPKKLDETIEGWKYAMPNKLGNASLFWLLASCLLLAILVSSVLWCLNRKMSAEIKIRTEAQDLLKLANKKIRKQAYTDELSGMGNRRAFYEQAEAEIKLATLDGKPLTALMIDIDYFKNFNDRFGHAVGDKAIQRLAAVILSIVRETDVQGRIGGEEFGIIIPNTGLKGAEDLAERIRSAVEAFELCTGKETVKLTVSIGVAAFELDGDSLGSLMVRADEALYKAKHRGRNQVAIRALNNYGSAITEPDKMLLAAS